MTDSTTPPAAPAAAPAAGPAPQGFGAPVPPQAAAVPPQGGPQGWGGPGQPQTPYGGYPVTAAGRPEQETGRPGLAVVAGIGAMLVSAAVYAGVIDLTKHEIGYLALAVGLLIGLALGKLGGRHPALPVVGVVLALLGIFLGEMLGIALLANKLDGVPLGTVLGHPGDLFSAWKESSDAMSLLFFAIGGLEAFVFTRRFSGAAVPTRRRRR
ncbi:XapX domain-containing protein [Streptacidiphilus sp. PB12-B1b]|uniref:hypothetical protein n=1 Tax=Streptacidiphilus sp. PB12-B1b TaxID=2705012 RepID=UPI0015FB0400|nr:hypothetical protein [Streptacidiphilus sp. PB12-B1b]QMU79284.1 XapX domain-containing protein [Streptacidiphilus sp. PB12-B1b]